LSWSTISYISFPPGLTASVAGASVVTLVDREPLALHCAMSTADLCGIPTGPLGNPEAAPGMVCAIRCDWAEASAALASQADVVLGSEVLYDPMSVSALVDTAAALLLPRGGIALIAEPTVGRAEGCRARLEEVAKLHGASVAEAPLPPALSAVAQGKLEPLSLLTLRFDRSNALPAQEAKKDESNLPEVDGASAIESEPMMCMKGRRDARRRRSRDIRMVEEADGVTADDSEIVKRPGKVGVRGGSGDATASNPGAGPGSAMSPPYVASQPPIVDERQAAVLQAAGFRWDEASGRWVRGDASNRQRRAAECRSGGRLARVVKPKTPNGGSSKLEVGCSTAASMGVRRLEQVLQDAREVALGTSDRDKEMLNNWKNELASPKAPWAWAAVQVAIGLTVCRALSLDFGASSAVSELRWAGGAAEPPSIIPAWAMLPTLPQWLPDLLPPLPPPPNPREIIVGFALAPLLFAARRSYSQAYTSLGIEPPVGGIERMIADGALDSHALPAPADWRQTSAEWRRIAVALEIIAACNIAAVTAGVLQPLGVVLLSRSKAMANIIGGNGLIGGIETAVGMEQYAALLAPVIVIAVSVASAAVVEEIVFNDDAFDGIPAEISAAERAAKTADAYFAMQAPAGTTAAAEAAEAAFALRAVATAWKSRFNGAADVQAKAPAAAAAGAATCGSAWQLGGGSVWAPVLATALALAAAYILEGKDKTNACVDVEL